MNEEYQMCTKDLATCRFRSLLGDCWSTASRERRSRIRFLATIAESRSLIVKLRLFSNWVGRFAIVFTMFRKSPEAKFQSQTHIYILSRLRHRPANKSARSFWSTSPSWLFSCSTSKAGVFPHIYFCDPKGLWSFQLWSLAAHAGARASRSHVGRHCGLLNGDLQSFRWDFQWALWQSLLQYCDIWASY